MMYTGTYGLEEGLEISSDRPQKTKWCSVVGAGCGAVLLLGVAYYLVSLASMQRLAYICVTLAGLTIMSCFVGLVFLVSGRPPRSTTTTTIADYKYPHYHDSPPKYRESWRRAYYTARRDDTTTDPSQGDPCSSSSSSLLPHSSLQKRSSSNTLSVSPIPPPVPHSTQPKSLPSSSSSTSLSTVTTTVHPVQQQIKCSVDLHVPPSPTSSEDELPSYQVAVEVMDADSLRKVQEEVESGM